VQHLQRCSLDRSGDRKGAWRGQRSQSFRNGQSPAASNGCGPQLVIRTRATGRRRMLPWSGWRFDFFARLQCANSRCRRTLLILPGFAQSRRPGVTIGMMRYGIDSEAKPSGRAQSCLPIANSVTAEKGMAGRNPPLVLLPAKFGPIRDSPGVHGRFLLLALAENILPPLLGNHRH
jgi:hypothetical protein